MAESAGRERWTHTSAVLALLANVHRDPKKGRAFTTADFHPYLRHVERTDIKVGIGVLRQVFVDQPHAGRS
ncbi:MAG: hypothetical protein LC104_07850 [Bacteroidales bacterium]|nr:hypothetical protein [Bacteroidales bacterium]